MTYLRRSNNGKKQARAVTFVIISFLILIFVLGIAFPRLYAGMFYPVAAVLWKAESSTISWFAAMGSMAGSKYSLIKENERLSQELAARDSSLLLLNTLKNENEDLKTLAGRKQEFRSLLAVILARPPISSYDTIVIDVGSNDGVALGDKVYAEGDVLVGDVTEVYAHQSKATLFSAPGRIVPVLIGSSNVEASATGRGAGNFIAKLPAEVGVREGDTVVLPQLKPHVFGVVEKVLIDSTASLETILFKAPVNINELRFVEVGLTLPKGK